MGGNVQHCLEFIQFPEGANGIYKSVGRECGALDVDDPLE